MTKTEEQETIIINRPGRSTYPEQKSVLTSGATPVHMSDTDLDELEAFVRRIAEENLQDQGSEEADRAFHLLIARATRNMAIVNVVEELWRPISSASALLFAKVRSARSKAVVEERRAIARVLRARDPSKARAS